MRRDRGERDQPLRINMPLGRAGWGGLSVSTMVVGRGGGEEGGGQTHSCKERLQYKSIRGVPFLCICTMT